MKKAAIFILAILLAAAALAGCGGGLPVYKRWNNKNGMNVEIDGVQYQMYPDTIWDMQPETDIIGYAGNRGTMISYVQNDTVHNFIFVQDVGASMYYTPLHRSDLIIEEPSAHSVDRLMYSETKVATKTQEREFYYTEIDDKDIIKSLFHLLDYGQQIESGDKFTDYGVKLTCYSSELPGAYFDLRVDLYSDKVVCESVEYAEIPLELLESIAGKDLDYLVAPRDEESTDG